MSQAEIVSFNVSPSTDNVREVLGFFHYQLSQQAKEIAVLNRRVAQLMQMGPEQEKNDLSRYIESSDRRFDSFATTIQAMTDQLRHVQVLALHSHESFSSNVRDEFNQKIENVEIHVNEIGNSSKALSDLLRLKLSEVEQHARARESSVNDGFDQLQAELAALRPLIASLEEKVELTNPLALKESPPRPESSHRRHHRPALAPKEIESMTIMDVQPTVCLPGSRDCEGVRDEVQELKLLIEAQQFDPRVLDPEFRHIHQRIDECAKKSDLYELTQCFIASGAEGVAEYALRNKATIGKAPEESRPLARGRQVARQTSTYVKIISGDCFKRPTSNHVGRQMRSCVRSGD
jgi:hypothetical protein